MFSRAFVIVVENDVGTVVQLFGINTGVLLCVDLQALTRDFVRDTKKDRIAYAMFTVTQGRATIENTQWYVALQLVG